MRRQINVLISKFFPGKECNATFIFLGNNTYFVQPSMMKKATKNVKRLISLTTAGIKDPRQVARFQRHHCRSTASVHLLPVVLQPEQPFESSHGRGCNFGLKVSEWLSTSREELLVILIITSEKAVELQRYRRNVGRVARTNFFKNVFWVRCGAAYYVRRSENSAAALPWDD